MRITTLGTSHGNPTDCRFHTSTLFEIGDRSYLVDCGEPAAALMIRAGKSFEALAGVFVTHVHGDHISGLPNLARLTIKFPRKTSALRVLLPEAAAVEGLGAWMRAMNVSWPSPKVEVGVSRPGPIFDDGNLRVTALPTRHIADPGHFTCGFLLEAEGRRVIVTGDLRGDFTDFPALAREAPCDLLLCEMTHFPPAVAAPVLARCPAGRLVFIHIHDPWHGEAGEARLREAFAELPYPFEIAHDGDVFDLEPARAFRIRSE